MKVGDKLQIHCYKHNGKIDRLAAEAIVLDEQPNIWYVPIIKLS